MGLFDWLKKPKVTVKRLVPSDIESQVDTVVNLRINLYTALKQFNPSMDHWRAVVKAMAFAESSFNILERYEEKGLSTDSVTGDQIWSEGLMQLSQQDAPKHGANFNWAYDKKKDDYDQTKTIFNVFNNIDAALKILNKQIITRGVLITDGNPYYWAVLDKQNPRHKVFLEKYNSYISKVTINTPAPTTPVVTPAPAAVPTTKGAYNKIAIIVGHGSGDSGAVSWDGKRNEFEYNSNVAEKIKTLCSSKTIKTFYRDGRGISGVNKDARKWGGDLTLELHLNSFNGVAKGCEILALSGDKASIKFGQDLATAFCNKFGRIKRDGDGVKELTSKDRGHYSLALVDDPPPSVLIEPFFIDNKSEWIPPEELAGFLADFINAR